MYCARCSQPLQVGYNFCPRCGLRVGMAPPGPQDAVCGFCGRPPDQVGNLVYGASGSTICRRCTTNLLAIFDAPDLPKEDKFIIQVEPDNPQ